jgi:ATP phosphoribosyltransferase regulatory subunit
MVASKKVKDLLPQEAQARQAVIQKITSIFEKYDYAPIVTPTFEPYELLNKGLTKKLEHVSYKFFDHHGRMMILRPDITTQVARVVAKTLAAEKKPIRLYYSGDVYRAQDLAIGQENQFHQLGVELFNLPAPQGDKEILQLAEDVLKKLGLKNYELAVTDVRDMQKLSAAQKSALQDQDFVRLGRLPEKQDLLAVDLDYYTGLYFECYVPEVGYVLGSGGRYDRLVEAFGEPKKAVGFAFDLHRLMVALTLQKVI